MSVIVLESDGKSSHELIYCMNKLIFTLFLALLSGFTLAKERNRSSFSFNTEIEKFLFLLMTSFFISPILILHQMEIYFCLL
jgi:hypothetical protein